MEWNCRVRRNPPLSLNQRDERQYIDEPQRNQRACTEGTYLPNYIIINVNDERIKALIDSGSEVNIIHSKFLYQRQVDENKRTNLKGIGGSTESFGQASIVVSIEDQRLQQNFQVVDEKVSCKAS